MSKLTADLIGFREAHSMLSFIGWEHDSSTFWPTSAPWQKAIALRRSWKVDQESIAGYWVALGRQS